MLNAKGKTGEMTMRESDIKVGASYSSPRWKGDRKVTAIKAVKLNSIVHYLDMRTMRTGNSPLELFASNATGYGQVANV